MTFPGDRVSTRLSSLPDSRAEASLSIAPDEFGSMRPAPAWAPYGSLKIPTEKHYTRLFEGTQIDGGPELTMRMAVGGGRMAPMSLEAQKLYFRAIADVAISNFSKKDCERIRGFIPFKDRLMFVVSTGKKDPPWEEKYVDFQAPRESEPNPHDPLVQPHFERDELLGATIFPEGHTATHFKDWFQSSLYPLEARRRGDEDLVLDLRPRRAFRSLTDAEKESNNASMGLKRLLYLLMLAHEGVGDHLHSRTSLRDLRSGQIEDAMDDLFGHTKVAEAGK